MIKLVQREYRAIVIGAIVYGLFFSSTELLKDSLVKDYRPIDSPYFEILSFIIQIFATIAIALPGYVTGWLSVRSGTINGFLLMLVCTTVSFLILYSDGLVSSKIFFNLGIYFSALLVPITIGALGGAAGQYHKELRKRL